MTDPHPTPAAYDVEVVRLSDGRDIRLDDIRTSDEGEAILVDVDDAIDSLENKIRNAQDGFSPNDPDWRRRAEIALKRKRRSRPRIQQRIGVLRKAERAAKPLPDATTSPKDGKRKAFIKAAEQLLDRETVTEIWARAREMRPGLFADGDTGDLP